MSHTPWRRIPKCLSHAVYSRFKPPLGLTHNVSGSQEKYACFLQLSGGEFEFFEAFVKRAPRDSGHFGGQRDIPLR